MPGPIIVRIPRMPLAHARYRWLLHRRVIPHPQPQRTTHLRQRPRALREVPLQPKMHMQNQVLPEVIPKMLAHSQHPLQLSPVNHRRIGKPSLRPIHPNSLPRKRSRVPLSPSMNLISLWHLLSTSSRSPAFDAAAAPTKAARRLQFPIASILTSSHKQQGRRPTHLKSRLPSSSLTCLSRSPTYQEARPSSFNRASSKHQFQTCRASIASI